MQEKSSIFYPSDFNVKRIASVSEQSNSELTEQGEIVGLALKNGLLDYMD